MRMEKTAIEVATDLQKTKMRQAIILLRLLVLIFLLLLLLFSTEPKNGIREQELEWFGKEIEGRKKIRNKRREATAGG